MTYMRTRSYEKLIKCYNLLGKENFWKFLPLRNCILSKVGNPIISYFKKITQESHKSSELNKMENSFRCSDLGNLGPYGRGILAKKLTQKNGPASWWGVVNI